MDQFPVQTERRTGGFPATFSGPKQDWHGLETSGLQIAGGSGAQGVCAAQAMLIRPDVVSTTQLFTIFNLSAFY